MLKRDKNSHKGQNGKVMVIGGSPMFYGAPILSALGAEATGVDLIFPFIPAAHIEAAKTYSLNFILQTFEGESLSSKDAKTILNFSPKADAVVIGPGLGTDPGTLRAVKTLLAHLTIPTVVDASALISTHSLPETVVLTPHHGEFKKLTGEDASEKSIQKWAKHFNATIVCKGAKDIIADRDEVTVNDTGNAMMTVGGSGDVLSGVIGGFLAQGMKPFETCEYATKMLGKAAEKLAQMQGSLRAIDLVHMLPTLLDSH